MPSAGAGGGAGGMGGAAGTMAGSGGSTARAGSGGVGAGTGGVPAAGAPAEDDLFGGLFPDLGATSCEGLLCFETADCAALYPDENTTCKFTRCVDLVCQK